MAVPCLSVAYGIQAGMKQEGGKAKGKRQGTQNLFPFIKKTTALLEALPGGLLVTFMGQNWVMWSPQL